jgi:uncharacterized protein
MMSRNGADVILSAAPIDPSWIEAGDPEARCAILAVSPDRGAWTVLWECTSGRFTWRYDIEETAHFLGGSVLISAPGAAARRYGAGDTIHFPRGAVATWEVEGIIRKLAFCRRAPPRPLAFAIRIARGLQRRLRALARRARPANALMQA